MDSSSGRKRRGLSGLARAAGLLAPSGAPADAVVAVTHRCLARCVMCNVWKRSGIDALQPRHMRKLPPTLRTVNLSGGEPFLRDDLADFVGEIRDRCPAARLAISTNGLATDRIAATMAEVRRIDPTVRLAVSLDGLGLLHDQIRGVTGAFAAVVNTLERLRAEGVPGLRLAMTLTRANVGALPDVADFADKRGLELSVVAAHPCRTHLGVERLPAGEVSPRSADAFERVLRRWLRSWRPRRWLRAHFAWQTLRRLRGRPWRFPCRAGEGFFFVHADGTVYSCSVRGRAMGSLIDQGWGEIWHSRSAEDARRLAARCGESCWMICTARDVYRTRPLAVTAWVLARKLAAHLHLPPARRQPAQPG